MWSTGRRVAVSTASRRLLKATRKVQYCLTTSSSRQVGATVSLERFYSQTPRFHKNDKTGENKGTSNTLYQTLHNKDGLTDEQIEKIIEEEERKLEDEIKSKFVENWKPGMRKRPLQLSFSLEEFQYELEPEKHEPRWNLRDKRCGALAIKVGMVPVFDDVWGVRYPCTVLLVDQNVVLGHKTVEKNGYSAIQVAAGERKRKNVGKSVLGQYKNVLFEDDDDQSQNPPYLVREFRVTDEANLIPVGQQIHARHFVPGQNIDVAGISKGKGFQGAMKRHNFGGMPATHGVSKSHRALGSTGQCQDPGRVFKGKKMAGRMGADRVTMQNLRILKIDRGRNLIYVIGAVPGNKGNFVEIRDAVKKPLWRTDKVLDSLDRPPLPSFEFEEEIDGSGEPGHEVFMPMPSIDPLSPDAEDEAA